MVVPDISSGHGSRVADYVTNIRGVLDWTYNDIGYDLYLRVHAILDSSELTLVANTMAAGPKCMSLVTVSVPTSPL